MPKKGARKKRAKNRTVRGNASRNGNHSKVNNKTPSPARGETKHGCPEPVTEVVIDRIPILSYFTGGGLLDIGFLSYNFDVVWSNENNPAFIEGFEHGMATLMGEDAGHIIHNKDSIVDITPEQVAKEAFHNTERPETFGIIGGPPCPDFSNGGKNRGEEGDHGKLTEVYTDHILALQPSFFLLENVMGLFKTEKHKLFLYRLIARLSRDYCTSLTVLNALEYSVPQHRERVFLAGFNNDWLQENTNFDFNLDGNGDWFPWPEKHYDDPKNSYEWPGQIPFGGEPEMPGDIPSELMVGPQICDPAIDDLPNSQDQFRPWSKKFKKIKEGDDTRKSFKRLHRWRYSPTAAYGNNEVHLHPVQPRRLSVREVMRIQSVPDEYALPEDMSLTHKFKMIGNGVPVGLAEAVAGSFDKIVTGEWDGSSGGEPEGNGSG